MPEKLNQSELSHLETFVTTTLADPSSLSHQELIDAIHNNQELVVRALGQVQRPDSPTLRNINQADLNFLESWLKARNLILGGLQLLQMADPANATAIKHETECTETAFTLLPGLLQDAKRFVD